MDYPIWDVAIGGGVLMAVGFILVPVLAWLWLDPTAVRHLGGH